MNLINEEIVACPACDTPIGRNCFSKYGCKYNHIERYHAAEFFIRCSLELALDKAASPSHPKSEDFYSLVATVMEWLKDVNVQYSQEVIHPDPEATPIYERDERD